MREPITNRIEAKGEYPPRTIIRETLREMGIGDDDGYGSPNLDAQTPDLLMEFWYLSRWPRVLALRLFGQVKGNSGSVSRLGAYAANKACAMRLREKGAIDRAACYETICEGIYESLPEHARW